MQAVWARIREPNLGVEPLGGVSRARPDGECKRAAPFRMKRKFRQGWIHLSLSPIHSAKPSCCSADEQLNARFTPAAQVFRTMFWAQNIPFYEWEGERDLERAGRCHTSCCVRGGARDGDFTPVISATVEALRDLIVRRYAPRPLSCAHLGSVDFRCGSSIGLIA